MKKSKITSVIVLMLLANVCQAKLSDLNAYADARSRQSKKQSLMVQMQINKALAFLVQSGVLSKEEATARSPQPSSLMEQLRQQGMVEDAIVEASAICASERP
ncbi:MAG: hypothetical protein ACOYOK_01790 [Pseudobdellovibrionaceae bacterium]